MHRIKEVDAVKFLPILFSQRVLNNSIGKNGIKVEKKSSLTK